jgi:hypothetical protein
MGTHLGTSLKELQKLGVDAVAFAGAGIGAHVTVQSGYADLGSILASPGLFADDLNVTLSTSLDDSLLAASGSEIYNQLHDMGIDNIALQETLSASVDWFDFGNLKDIHDTDLVAGSGTGYLGFEVNVSGGTTAASQNFNTALSKAISSDPGELALFGQSGIDLLNSGVTTPEQFGNLISALTQSGVTDFVVESGTVQINDSLASAMVSAGMLQALPTANLIIDATAKIQTTVDSIDSFAHLYTNLKSLSELDVDGIRLANSVDHAYIDLGLPLDDTNALSDIKALLASLDPANDAKPFTNFVQHLDGTKVNDVSLVISSDIAKTILEGLDTIDMGRLEKLGINNIAVVDNTAAHNLTVNDIVPLQATPVLPEVQIIGHNTTPGTLFDELNPKH